jgi:hypothetical protein
MNPGNHSPRLLGFLLVIALCSLASSASAQERRVDFRFQGGVKVGVPIYFNVDSDIVKPGASINGWAGFDIGWFVVDFGFGLPRVSSHSYVCLSRPGYDSKCQRSTRCCRM